MVDARIHCTRCNKETNHLVVGRLAICSTFGCGHETKLEKGQQLKPAIDAWTGKEMVKMGPKRKKRGKLSDQDKETIRSRRAAGEKLSDIAADYKVCIPTVCILCKDIKLRKVSPAAEPGRAEPAAPGRGNAAINALVALIDERIEKALARRGDMGGKSL